MERQKRTYRSKEASSLKTDEQISREMISERLKESAKYHSFSPVYSKQYSYKSNFKKHNNTLNRNHKEIKMDEIYQMIEEKIKESGYKRVVSGFDIYNEICDLIDEKENGTYILMSKPYDDVVFEYCIDVMSDNFNLSYIHINDSNEQYRINFDN